MAALMLVKVLGDNDEDLGYAFEDLGPEDEARLRKPGHPELAVYCGTELCGHVDPQSGKYIPNANWIEAVEKRHGV
jgi:hypothetical protein